MATFILNVIAKRGHEDAVTELFESLQEHLEQADGFQSRTIYRAKDGLFLDLVKQTYTKEELDKMANQEMPGPEGVHFMIHEIWETPEQRMRYSRADEHKFTAQLVPHILPEHSHEFYETI
jgi:heme-degrading monooxygenase HmoA